MKAFILLPLLGMAVLCSASGKPPADIEDLFNGFVRECLEISPITATKLGLPAAAGFKVRLDRLDDISDRGQDRCLAFFRKYRDWLRQYDRKSLTASQAVLADLLAWYLDMSIEGDQWRYHRYLIDPIFGFHNELTTLMTEHHPLRTPADAEAYVLRLKAYRPYIGQLLDQLTIREQKRLLPPTAIVEAVDTVLAEFASTPAIDNILFTSFQDRISRIPGLSVVRQQQLGQAVIRTIQDDIYPSYRRVREYLQKLEPKTTADDGVWHLTDGDDYYAYCLRFHTSTSMTPDEVHDLGLAEVERIEQEIMALYRQLGIEGSAYREMMGNYWKTYLQPDNVQIYFPDNEEGKLQTLAAYQAIIDTMEARLPELFSTLPRARVRAERVPVFKEATAGTYYEQPKLDGSTPGIFYANLGYRHVRPNMQTLTYHEAIPGHHLQIALEQESPNTRLFKALIFFTGYVEGWALYAERLAKDYGFYADIHSRLGYLRSELFRAVRLVVDTGLHRKRWTREQVKEYMKAHAGWASDAEIDRYTVWPGQACAYKVGELTFIRLREQARQALADRFDIRTFHSALLTYGAMPLDQTERQVVDFIAGQK